MFRALLRLQPDIIIARLSQTATATTLMKFDSDQQQAALVDPQPAETIQPPAADKQVKRPCNGSWSFLSLFGSIEYRRGSYYTINKAQLGKSTTEQEREEVIAQYRAPAWLVNRAWRIQALKASSGWAFIPRTMNIVPKESKIFKYAWEGNIEGLRELLNRHEASPFDCDVCNRTALQVRKLLREEF